jgi:GGDEF domain-containing protein
VAFSIGRRRLSPPEPAARRHPEPAPRLLPHRFEPLAEALAVGSDISAACTEIGCAVAHDGASLAEALDALRATYRLVAGGEPSFEACRCIAVAWSEASLQYLHALSCEDPLTGLASLAHVRSRLAELYREADRRGGDLSTSYALVVVELVDREIEASDQHRFDRVLRLADVSECVRAVYSGGETLGRLGLDRAVVVVPRGAGLGQSVEVLRQLLMDWASGADQPLSCRVWIERVPVDNDGVGRLLDELAR